MNARIALSAALLAALSSTGAEAQRIKAKGAAAAGVCAGALEIEAGAKANAGAEALEVTRLQRARDFFAEMPRFEQAEIAANAEAFIRLMKQRLERAQSEQARSAIFAEIGKISVSCRQSVAAAMQQARGAPAAPAAGQVAPQAAAPIPQGTIDLGPIETMPGQQVQ